MSVGNTVSGPEDINRKAAVFPLGECPNCDARFSYSWGTETDAGVGRPCPECGSPGWGLWGYSVRGSWYSREDFHALFEDAEPTVENRGEA